MKAIYGDDTVYRKVGRKYVPFGVRYDENYLPDGIWYVHHSEYSHGTTNVPYIATMLKMGEPQKLNAPELCGMEEKCNEIMGSAEWKKMVADPKGCSLSDIVHLCVKQIYKGADNSNEA